MDGITYPIRTYGANRVLIGGSFAPNGSSAISAASNKGKGFTVARSTTGSNLITFKDHFAQVDAMVTGLGLNAGDDKFSLGGAIHPTANTAVLNTWDVSGGALTDVAAHANNRANFLILARAAGAEY